MILDLFFCFFFERFKLNCICEMKCRIYCLMLNGFYNCDVLVRFVFFFGVCENIEIIGKVCWNVFILGVVVFIIVGGFIFFIKVMGEKLIFISLMKNFLIWLYVEGYI